MKQDKEITLYRVYVHLPGQPEVIVVRAHRCTPRTVYLHQKPGLPEIKRPRFEMFLSSHCVYWETELEAWETAAAIVNEYRLRAIGEVKRSTEGWVLATDNVRRLQDAALAEAGKRLRAMPLPELELSGTR